MMNKRNTVQRSLVLEAVKEMRCHATADSIYQTIARKYPGISRGTVYRNLKLLSEIGEIRKVEMPSGATLYDHQCRVHYHARCVHCGQVTDVDMDYIADFDKNIRDTHGFQFTGHDVIFKGFCPTCNPYFEKEMVDMK